MQKGAGVSVDEGRHTHTHTEREGGVWVRVTTRRRKQGTGGDLVLVLAPAVARLRGIRVAADRTASNCDVGLAFAAGAVVGAFIVGIWEAHPCIASVRGGDRERRHMEIRC